MQKQTFFDGTCCFSGTSWQCFTMLCDIQQELIILAGTDKCLTSPKMNSIHFEGRRSLQTTKKRLTHPNTCHVCVDTRFTWYQVPESMLHRVYVKIQRSRIIGGTQIITNKKKTHLFDKIIHFSMQFSAVLNIFIVKT